MKSPIECITEAVNSAITAPLSDIESYNYVNRELPVIRKPTIEDLIVYQFPQTWSSTALGFGGIGGQSITNAYTTVIIHSVIHGGRTTKDEVAVYFNGTFAYLIENPNADMYKDIELMNMASVNERKKYLL